MNEINIKIRVDGKDNAVLQLTDENIKKLIVRMKEYDTQATRVKTGSSGMTTAIGQLGYAIGDADMFFINFRMGMMSVANNIPIVVQMFQHANDRAKDLGSTFKKELISSLTGAGGLLLGINALMFALNVLPRLFGDTTSSIKDQAAEIRNLKNEYAKLTREQINNYIQTREEEIRKIEARNPSKYYMSREGLELKNAPLSDQSRFGTDNPRFQALKAEVAALKEINRDLGVRQNIENRIAANQRNLTSMNENPASPFFYKNIVKTSESYSDAYATVQKWIEADQALVKSGKDKAEHKQKESDAQKSITEMSTIELLNLRESLRLAAQREADDIRRLAIQRQIAQVNQALVGHLPSMPIKQLGGGKSLLSTYKTPDSLQGVEVKEMPPSEITAENALSVAGTRALGRAWESTGDIMANSISRSLGLLTETNNMLMNILGNIINIGLQMGIKGLFGGLFSLLGGGGFWEGFTNILGITSSVGGGGGAGQLAAITQSANNMIVASEISALRADIQNLKVRAYLDNTEAKKIVMTGNTKANKSKG